MKPLPEYDRVLSELEISAEPFALCQLEGVCSMGLARRPGASLHYVLAGSGALTLKGHRAVALFPGALVLVPACVRHSLINDGAGPATLPVCEPAGLNLRHHGLRGDGEGALVVLCSTVALGLRGTHGLIDLLRAPLSLDTRNCAAVAPAIGRMLAEMASPRVGRAAMIRLLLLQCVIGMLRDRIEAGDPAVTWIAGLAEPALWPALRAMLDDPGADHGLQRLASAAGMSRSRFAERFQRACGRAPMAFLRELRMARAAHLLAGGRTPVKRIAGEVGFASRSAFSRAFADAWGQSPQAFRHNRAPDRAPDRI